VNKLVAQLRFDEEFGGGLAGERAGLEAQEKTGSGSASAMPALLLGGEVPVGVETVRIAGGQEELLGSVGFGQVLGLGRRLLGGWLRAEGELLGRGLGRRRRGGIAFQEERWDFQRLLGPV